MQDTGNTMLKGDPGSDFAIWSRFLGPLFALRRSVVYAIVVGMVLLIAGISSYIGVRKVLKIEPFDIFRG